MAMSDMRQALDRIARVVRLAVAVMASAVVLNSHGFAQPVDRPIRVIVPFPPGGATDVAARLVTDAMSRATGTSFVIENRGGAGGNIGLAEAAKSVPDGTTILVMNDAIASNPHYFRLNFDPATALVPVVQLARQPVVIAVHPGLGVASLAELVAVAGKRDISYGTAGAGSQHHILTEWFAREARIKLVHVAYRGGGVAVNDLVGGHLPMATLASTPFIPLARDGQVRLLAQSGATRAASLPDVPTFRESGYPELVLDQWTGIFVPRGTPEAVTSWLQREASKALIDPQVRAKLDALAVEPVGGTQEQFAKLFRADFERYRILLERLDIKNN